MTSLWGTLTGNFIINVAISSWASAQIIKTLLTFIHFKEFRAERLIGSGGMPSSHSALVCSLAMSVGRTEGFSSSVFALCVCFAAVVMYDAMGVRRAAGEQAKVLNKMIFSFKDIGKLFDGLNDDIVDEFEGGEKDESENGESGNGENDHIKILKEFLGHTPLEVLGGALLGIIIGSYWPIPV